MSAIESRRSAFATLVACYHNSFANVKEGRIVHSPGFIKKVIESGSPDASAALGFDPQMTSTDVGAVAVGIARRVMTNESASRSFIDIELGESAFIVSFDKTIKPDAAATVLAPCGNVATLCKAGDMIGEGMISDLCIFAVEAAPAVVESLVAAEKATSIVEGEAYTPAKHAEWLKTNTHAVVTFHAGHPVAVSANMPEAEAHKHAKEYYKDGAAEVILHAQAKQIRHHMDTGESWSYHDRKPPAGASVKEDALAPVVPAAAPAPAANESIDLSKCPLTKDEIKGLYEHAYGASAWGTLVENEREMAALKHMLKVFALPKIKGAKNETGRAGFDKDFAMALKVMRADPTAVIAEEAVEETALIVHKHFAQEIPKLAEATILCTGAEKAPKLSEGVLSTSAGTAEIVSGIARCLLMSEGIVPAALAPAIAKWESFVAV